MLRSKLIIVSDSSHVVESAKSFAYHHGVKLEVYSTSEWENKENGSQTPASGFPVGQAQQGAKILPFPGASGAPAGNEQVQTINQLESLAIKEAIFKFNGNLTEAAKALGIGRATLYRKVKLYDIDPSEARRRNKMAA